MSPDENDDFFGEGPPVPAEPAPAYDKAAQEAAFAEYRTRRNMRVGDVVFEYERGRWVVTHIDRDPVTYALTPKIVHRFRPGFNAGKPRPPRPPPPPAEEPETVEDILAYALKVTGGGKVVIDGFIAAAKNKDLPVKDQLWALERLRVMLGKAAEKEKPTTKPGAEILLPDGLPELTCVQLADLHAFCRDRLGFDADRVRVDGTRAEAAASVQPAPAVPEAGDLSLPE